jgi:hypothetical protein
VKAAEQKKKRKRRAASPPPITTPTIPTPRSREVGSEDEEEAEKEKDEAVKELPAAERPESPAAKRQRELVQETSEDALRRGLEAQCSAAAARAKIPGAIGLAEDSASGRTEVQTGGCETWVPLGPHRPGSRPCSTSGSGLLEDPPTCQWVQST